jgi:ribosomal protein S18 acetylase RimI-like enzyme
LIREIDFKNKKAVFELYELQKISYQVEAELIRFFDIPALKESFEEFLKCKEVFWGYFEAGKLVGAISCELEREELTICRMVVHPDHFRQGIAKNLLLHLVKTFSNIGSIVVSTGKDNLPAKTLYLKNGFQFVRDLEVAPGFFISCFERTNKHQAN